jgi:hypothetical protein
MTSVGSNKDQYNSHIKIYFCSNRACFAFLNVFHHIPLKATRSQFSKLQNQQETNKKIKFIIICLDAKK